MTTITKRVKEWKEHLSGVEYSLNTQFENSYQYKCTCKKILILSVNLATGSQVFGYLNEAKRTSQNW